MGHGRYHTAVVSPFMEPAAKLQAVRAALPSLAAGIQLNAGTTGPMPAEVAAAMAELTEYERSIGRAHVDYYLEALDRRNEARAGVAAVLGASLESIALTRSTTEGLNIAAWGLDWQPGDVAVTTIHEHIGGLGPLYGLRDRRGVEVRFAEIGDGSDDEATLAAFDRAIVPGTRLVAISQVLWTTGAVLPVARIAEMARERGATVVVDGAQAVGAIPVSVADAGRRRVRAAGPEVAARARGHGCALGRAGGGGADPAHLRRLLRLRGLRLAGRRDPASRRSPLRDVRVPSDRRSPASPGRSAGCRCTSGSISSSVADRSRRTARRWRSPASRAWS